MDSLKTFKKWCEILTARDVVLNKDHMYRIVEQLLPGYSFGRSSRGPRANKYIYDESGKCVFKSNYNHSVLIYVLENAADTERKKAVLNAYKTIRDANLMLYSLRHKFKFDIEIIINEYEKFDSHIFDIRLENSSRELN